MIRQYDKLVRDKMPDIIMADGYTPVCKTEVGRALTRRLVKKLAEEAAEVGRAFEKGDWTQMVRELADLIEVMGALVEREEIQREGGREAVEEVREKKRQERGGFELGIVLLEIDFSDESDDEDEGEEGVIGGKGGGVILESAELTARRALEKIRDGCGRVYTEWLDGCDHEGCDDSVRAALIAGGVLRELEIRDELSNLSVARVACEEDGTAKLRAAIRELREVSRWRTEA